MVIQLKATTCVFIHMEFVSMFIKNWIYKDIRHMLYRLWATYIDKT